MSKRYKVSVPTGDCRGVDVQGPYGEITHYNARDGIIETDSSYHAGLIRKTLGVSGRLVGMTTVAPSVLCDVCGQEIYVAFGPTCWRCRGSLRQQDRSDGSNRRQELQEGGEVGRTHDAIDGSHPDQDGLVDGA